MRTLIKYLDTRPELVNIPYSRILTRRGRYLDQAHEDTSYEMFTKGVLGGDVMALVAGGDSILARQLRKEHPEGGVFDYHDEKKKRNINPSTQIISMCIFVTLEDMTEIFVRYQSDYRYTQMDFTLVLAATKEFFKTQKLKVIS